MSQIGIGRVACIRGSGLRRPGRATLPNPDKRHKVDCKMISGNDVVKQ